MRINPIPQVCYGDFLAVTNDCRKDAEDMAVGNPVFKLAAVVAADHIIFVPYPKNTVEHILAIIAPIQRYIISFQPSLRLFCNHHQVTVLTKQRQLKVLKNISAARKRNSANVTLGVPFLERMSYTYT